MRKKYHMFKLDFIAISVIRISYAIFITTMYKYQYMYV